MLRLVPTLADVWIGATTRVPVRRSKPNEHFPPRSIGQTKHLSANLVKIDFQADLAVLEPFEDAAKAAAAVEQLAQLDFGFVAGPILEIAGPNQRPVDAGRRDLQVV